MRLIKFEVIDYKSSKNSGICWTASDITILAGKNESGKTACLEALRDYDADIEEIPDTAHSVNDADCLPEIKAWWTLSDDEIQEIVEESEVNISKTTIDKIKKNGLQIIKDADGTYWFDDEIEAQLNEADREALTGKLAEINANFDKIKALHDKFKGIPSIAADQKGEAIKTAITNAINSTNELINAHEDENIKQQATALLNALRGQQKQFSTNDSNSAFTEAIKDRLPKFIFYSSFDDGMLPYEIALAEAKTNTAVVDFAKIAGIDLDKIAGITDIQKRTNVLSTCSAKITGDFKAFWHQDEIELTAMATDGKLVIGIKENGKTTQFKPNQRSKGFQWFLSFYLRLKAQGASGNEAIILIDEPGLYLHAKAQSDVLNVLENLAEKFQIVISTHSPYLIDSNRLDRIRLVLREAEGTRIENKVHKNANQESLTPIVTSIGLDVTRSLSLVKEHNVILEGITDYFYLSAFRKLLKREKADYALIPCVGAQKVPSIASMLIGWGLNFAALLDQDKEGRDAQKQLREKLLVASSKIVMASNTKDGAIEDLFSVDDFKAHVLQDKDANVTSTNAHYLKGANLDKALLAKKFYERALDSKSPLKLSTTTNDAFKQVFDALDKALASELFSEIVTEKQNES